MSAQLPWEIQEARDVLAEASRDQANHRDKIKEAIKAHARAKHLHRVALAQKMAALRSAGTAAAMTSKLAQGDEAVSLLERNADELDGDREIAVQEGWRLNANRKDAQALAEWSMRKDLAIDYGSDPEPTHFHDVSAPRVQ